MSLVDVAVWILPALALAAGVDLYLTLFTLGIASRLGFWETLPGALGDLDSVGAMVITGAFFLAEPAAERRLLTSLVWNGLHAFIRPLAGALLSLLVLDGRDPTILITGSLATATLVSLAHATATGGSLLLWLSPGPRVRPLLASLLEDAAVVGLVVLALDRPRWSALAVMVLVLTALLRTRANLEAFLFTARLGVGRIRVLLGRRARWLQGRELPHEVEQSLASTTPAPQSLRAVPGALVSFPGRPPILRGWMAVGGSGLCFVPGGSGRPLDLSATGVVALEEDLLHHSLRLEVGESVLLHLVPDGPPPATLRAELGLPHGPPATRFPGTPSSPDG